MPESAAGIPDRAHYQSHEALAPGQLIDYVLHKHLAEKAGPHYDLRLGTPELGLLSWAVRKGLPEPGQKHLAVEQPTHAHPYGQFEGEIPSGYGKGTVKREDAGKALVTRVGPDSLHYTVAHKGDPLRYLLARTGEKQWLLQNQTPQKAIPYQKAHYKSVPPEQAEQTLENLPAGATVQPKIDGAAVLLQLLRSGPELMSYRTGSTGLPIVHSERAWHERPKLSELPRELEGSILRGELYGTRNGRSIPVQELSALLNSSPARSIENQRARGTDLRTMLFNIQQHGKKPVGLDVPYTERRRLLDEVLQHVPSKKLKLSTPDEEASEPAAALRLWKAVQSGKRPDTREGVVIHPEIGIPTKIKQREERDVFITGVEPGAGKYQDRGAGAVWFSDRPDGPPLGKFGTGLSDELRRDIWAHPEQYLGRQARIHYQEVLPSGALRMPVFLGLHEG